MTGIQLNQKWSFSSPQKSVLCALSLSLAHAQQVTYFKLKFIVPSEFTYFLYDQGGPDTFFSASSLPVKHVPVQSVEQNRPRTR